MGQRGRRSGRAAGTEAVKKETSADVARELAESHERWLLLYEYGGSDPFYPDGINLNLVRNHIIYYRSRLEELCQGQELPEIYYRPLPPAVDNGYMARADEIRETAQKSLEKYLADRHYIYIKGHAHQLSRSTMSKCSVPHVLGYVTALRDALKNGDLVTMRRHCRPETYLSAFKDCEDRIRNEMRALRECPQQSLFSLFAMDGETDDDGQAGDDSENDEEQYEGIGML